MLGGVGKPGIQGRDLLLRRGQAASGGDVLQGVRHGVQPTEHVALFIPSCGRLEPTTHQLHLALEGLGQLCVRFEQVVPEDLLVDVLVPLVLADDLLEPLEQLRLVLPEPLNHRRPGQVNDQMLPLDRRPGGPHEHGFTVRPDPGGVVAFDEMDADPGGLEDISCSLLGRSGRPEQPDIFPAADLPELRNDRIHVWLLRQAVQRIQHGRRDLPRVPLVFGLDRSVSHLIVLVAVPIPDGPHGLPADHAARQEGRRHAGPQEVHRELRGSRQLGVFQDQPKGSAGCTGGHVDAGDSRRRHGSIGSGPRCHHQGLGYTERHVQGDLLRIEHMGHPGLQVSHEVLGLVVLDLGGLSDGLLERELGAVHEQVEHQLRVVF